MKKKNLGFLILLCVFIFSAFEIDERIEDGFNFLIYILFGVLLFLFLKKNKVAQEFTISFQEFFSYSSLLYFILDKNNEIFYFDNRNHKKINEFLEQTDNLNKLLEYLNVSKEHIEMINLFLSKNENFEISANYELKNVAENIMMPFFKIAMIYDEKSKNKILFFTENANKNLLKIANYHNLGFFKLTHEKDILDENEIANKIGDVDEKYIFSLVEKNFIQRNEKDNQNMQNQFLYIHEEKNYLISIFQRISFDLLERRFILKYIILTSESKELNFWSLFFAENFIPIGEMNQNFEILKANKKLKEILRFFSDKNNNFFDFFEIQKDGEHSNQSLIDELKKNNVMNLDFVLKFDSNSEFTLFFQRAGDLILIYVIQGQANKNLEMNFNHSQKMQVIGNLASGIAHDFNNLLTGMIGFCDLLMQSHASDMESTSMLIHIKQNIVRAIDLIKKLSTFSKRQKLKIEVIDIQKTMRNIVDLLKRIIGENIELNVEYKESDILQTEIDQSQFEQIIINLLVNSRDAIKKNGRIDILIDCVHIKDSHYKIHPSLKVYSVDGEKIEIGDYIIIRISDNGDGIEESKANNIFEPFYTTKERGSGLGLSMIYGALKQVSGYIFFTTEIGIGSTFYIFLKKYSGVIESSESEDMVQIDFSPKLNKQHRIVLVEDENSVREFVTQALKNLNYDVIPFESSEEGLEFLKNYKHGVDLIITDVMMPKVNGYDFMNEVKINKKYEKTKFLFISGYMENTILQSFENGDLKCEFLAKPFTLKSLLKKVEEILYQ